MGVFRDRDGVQVREIFTPRQAYRPEQITGFGIREQESITPRRSWSSSRSFVLADGSEVWITSLATYG